MIQGWGIPDDGVAWGALMLAGTALVTSRTRFGRELLGEDDVIETRLFLWTTAFASAFASLLWIAHYLRGGPRIVDASMYWLQGRALSHGAFSWPVHDPTASFRGRFLDYLPGEGKGPGSLAGIFPPGYPLLLALGFSVQAPMLVGPILAGALVFATYRLGRTLAVLHGQPALAEAVGRTAALLSFACAALRFHTAETMSHGATALFVALAFDASLRGRPARFGLSLGAIVATRPVSALAIALVGTFALSLRPSSPLASRRESRLRMLVAVALGCLPGVSLLLASQKAATGSWFGSTQRMYYAHSDGPSNCFRWGFGANVGCLHEHGEFVKARLAEGYGALAALGTTLRRLQLHAMDVANFEPLVLVVALPWLARKSAPHAQRFRGLRGETLALALVVLHIAAYAPFYFDGNFPGGGGRFFADVLPVEHALVALALTLSWAKRPAVTAATFTRRAGTVLAMALAGFAFHASFSHRQLAERDGGLPMFEPDRLTRAKIDRGLVFVDTDHGFALGHDPFALPDRGILIARRRGDARDRLLYDRLGAPRTYLYEFQSHGAKADAGEASLARVTIAPWVPPPIDGPALFEAEAEWPVIAQTGGFAAPVYVDTCASRAQALVLSPAAEGEPASATFELPVATDGTYLVTPHILAGARAPFTDHLPRVAPEAVRGELTIVGGSEDSADKAASRTPARWTWTGGQGCASLEPQEIHLAKPRAIVHLRGEGGPVAIDSISVTTSTARAATLGSGTPHAN